MSVVIRAMTETDLPAASRVCRTAFGTFLGAPDIENFWADRDLVFGRFGNEHTAAFAAELDGEIVGSNFATRWGSVGFFGPLSVRPDRQGRGVSKPLVAAVSDEFDRWGTRHNGLFTFAQSALHVGLYGQFGFHARFLTAIMAAPAQQAGDPGQWSRYSALSEDDRRALEAACRDVTETLYEGLDLGAEIRTLAARGFGDTLLLWEGRPSRLAGFAVCHWGPTSEAGEGCCFVKFGAVRAGAGAEERFAALLDAASSLAASVGMPTLLAGVNLAREKAYRHMLARGFRTQIQGVTMHRPNDWGYSRPDDYILDDWR
ncbi:MAG TPA: GNAT family N-acetyltransferase [Stellaceae bacterium]|nr:GNAT family N-acetyltransferase [Stellaceae bacterium]